MVSAHRFHVALPPERAMHLFTPVGERLWVPGWAPRFPAGESGDGSAPGTVFLTDDTHWVVIDRTPDRVRYARVTPGVRAGTVEVRVEPDGEGTSVEVTYDITPLVEGDDHAPDIVAWEAAIAAAVSGG
jgi:hypothetical protein